MTKRRCECAQVVFRNNLDSTRDYMILGDKKCRTCRGSGFIETCPDCDGAGVASSAICARCGGPGKIRAENSGKFITRKI